MAVQFSPTMQAYMAEHNIKPSQVCYLTICKGALGRILSGDKRVEFREYNGHYVKRLFSVKDNEIADAKPYTHILLQAGYSPTSPRALVRCRTLGLSCPRTQSLSQLLVRQCMQMPRLRGSSSTMPG